ncbi:MAG: ABC transporter permease subunit [Dehalococcoidia bacterium]|nr:ABC transporter permease subunit [Dehalococcoidia bacterium]
MPTLEVGEWIADIIRWLRDNISPFFDAITWLLDGPIEQLDQLLHQPWAIVIALIAAAIAYWVRGWQFAVFAFLGLVLVDRMDRGMWDPAMQTLALIFVATMTAIIVAVPFGIIAARYQPVSFVVRPVLDFMQTLPVFVYLMPAVAFLGIGVVPGAVATIIFAVPPGVRLTELGIRQVDPELIEAASAFGATDNQVLTGVQLPMALPTIMAGSEPGHHAGALDGGRCRADRRPGTGW